MTERVALTPEESKAVVAAQASTPLTLLMVVETIKAEAIAAATAEARDDLFASRGHASWGTDPTGYCGCEDCGAPDDEEPS